ncbi:MAG: Inner membrane protein YgiZ [Candidatus Erwinia impunctatus]|nr:Inner membrane protein YgiZ [Culicoides impunctatus]
MKIDRTRLIEIISLGAYFILVYVCMQVFNINEYDWMREPGDSVCSIPRDPDDTRDITAPLFLLLLGMPLLIALVRDIFIKDIFKALLYGFGLIVVIIYWWWSFLGQFSACVAWQYDL